MEDRHRVEKTMLNLQPTLVVMLQHNQVERTRTQTALRRAWTGRRVATR